MKRHTHILGLVAVLGLAHCGGDDDATEAFLVVTLESALANAPDTGEGESESEAEAEDDTDSNCPGFAPGYTATLEWSGGTAANAVNYRVSKSIPTGTCNVSFTEQDQLEVFDGGEGESEGEAQTFFSDTECGWALHIEDVDARWEASSAPGCVDALDSVRAPAYRITFRYNQPFPEVPEQEPYPEHPPYPEEEPDPLSSGDDGEPPPCFDEGEGCNPLGQIDVLVHVVPEGGDPIEGATVQVQGDGRDTSALTGADGHVTVTGPLGTELSVVACADGYGCRSTLGGILLSEDHVVAPYQVSIGMDELVTGEVFVSAGNRLAPVAVCGCADLPPVYFNGEPTPDVATTWRTTTPDSLSVVGAQYCGVLAGDGALVASFAGIDSDPQAVEVNPAPNGDEECLDPPWAE